MRISPVLAGMALAGVFYSAGTLLGAQDVSPAQAIKDRIANFKEIGTAFKAIRDELKASSPSMPTLQNAARRIESYGSKIPTWFPPGTGREAQSENVPKEEKTHAKPEVWTQRADFEETHRKFLAEAKKMNAVAQTGDAAAVAAQFKALGEGCKNCHQTFKEKDH